MKKTLIAMAVLSAASASFAQVTITGNLAMGYKSSFSAPNKGPALTQAVQGVTEALAGGTGGNPTGDSSGFGVDTSQINFAATEDLGGGMSIAAEMALAGADRSGESGSGTVSGRDARLKLTTSVGQFGVRSYKPDDYLSGSISGVGGVGMDNKVFQRRDLKETFHFDTKLGAFYFGFVHAEAASASPTAPSSGTSVGTGSGLGVGSAGAAATTGQRSNSYALTYVDGPLIANVNYVTYDSRSGNVNTLNKDVIRTKASYDLGFMKVGGGVEVLTLAGGGTLTNSLLAVAVPMGSLTLGANYAQGTLANSSAQTFQLPVGPGGALFPVGFAASQLDQTRSGYSLSATYALSKRTSVIADYANWLPSAGKDRNSQTRLLLSQSF